MGHDSLVVKTVAWNATELGSILGRGLIFFLNLFYFFFVVSLVHKALCQYLGLYDITRRFLSYLMVVKGHSRSPKVTN